MVRVPAKGLRHNPLELRFHLLGSLSRREAGAVAYPENVGVDGKGFLAEGGIEDDIRRLPPDSRQRLKLLPSAGNLTAEIPDQRL